MNYDEIFEQYYTAYRAEATAPDSTDDEYAIGLRFANNAIRRWASFDNTYWKELFTTAVTENEAQTTTAGVDTYDMPSNYRAIGGYVRLLDADGVVKRKIPLVDPQEGQFLGDSSDYCWVSGDPNNGAVLRFNVAPIASGETIEFDYYKSPTLLTTGSSVPEMYDPDFIVDHMLALRYRASRNPYYNTAKRDAENKLGQMKMTNDSGSWANPWTIPDRSGSIWGGEQSNSSLVL